MVDKGHALCYKIRYFRTCFETGPTYFNQPGRCSSTLAVAPKQHHMLGPEERIELREKTGGDQIPTLVTEDGAVYRGTRTIFRYLEGLEPWEHAAAHRRRFDDHEDARREDVPGRLVARAELKTSATAVPEQREPVVRDNPEASRYELRLYPILPGRAPLGR